MSETEATVGISRADAEALVDGMKLKVEPAVDGLLGNGPALMVCGVIESTYNKVLRGLIEKNREAMVLNIMEIQVPLMPSPSDPNELVSGMPMRWKCTHGHEDCEVVGTVWKPNAEARRAASGDEPADDWWTAKHLGLTADKRPDPKRKYVMLAVDHRPGVLELHYLDELERAE